MKHKMVSLAGCLMNGFDPGGQQTEKSFEKVKKHLTNERLRDRISKLATRATVPCKLNNVRQTKHLGQLYGLFKSLIETN